MKRVYYFFVFIFLFPFASFCQDLDTEAEIEKYESAIKKFEGRLDSMEVQADFYKRRISYFKREIKRLKGIGKPSPDPVKEGALGEQLKGHVFKPMGYLKCPYL